MSALSLKQRRAFLRLPMKERRKRLRRQAAVLKKHYDAIVKEYRKEWIY